MGDCRLEDFGLKRSIVLGNQDATGLSSFGIINLVTFFVLSWLERFHEIPVRVNFRIF